VSRNKFSSIVLIRNNEKERERKREREREREREIAIQNFIFKEKNLCKKS